MGSFRNRLLVLIIGLVVVTQTVTLAAVLASTRRNVEARAAEQLRSGELSSDAAATMVENCAALATQAAAELERLARGENSAPAPGQDTLL
jgi:hypothetical protein